MIADTIAEALAAFDEIPGEHEILVVDDGSSDRTWEIIDELARNDERVRVFRHSENRGLAAAQRTLIGNANGKYIFHIGADREWRMAEMIPMLAALEGGGYDICIGVRRKKKYTLSRRIASAGFNWSVALLWGEHFGDLGSIKLARASLWKRIPIRSGSAFVNAERVLIARRNGARIVKVPVDHAYRSTGASKFTSPIQSLRALGDLVRLRFSAASRYDIPPEHEGDR